MLHISHRRLLWPLLPLLALLWAATACSASPAAESGPPPPAAPVTLSLWHALPPDQAKLLQEIADAWAADRTDGATVQLEVLPDEAQLQSQLQAAVQAENSPAIALLSGSLPTYIESNALLPLDGLMREGPDALTDEERDDLFAPFLDGVRDRSGTTYGWPLHRDQTLLFINRSRVEALGGRLPVRSWDDLVQLCAAHMAQGGGTCLSAYPSASVSVLWIWAQGGEVLNKAGTAPEFQGAGGEAVLRWLAQLRAVEGVTAAHDYEEKVAAFASGASLFTFDSTAALPAYEARINSAFDMAVLPPPSATGEPTTVATGLNGVIFRSTAEREAIAWSFLRALTAAETNERWALAVGGYPIRHSSVEALNEQWPSFSRLRQAAAWLDDARAEPVVAGWNEVGEHLAEAMVKTLTGSELPEVALAEAARRCAVVLRR